MESMIRRAQLQDADGVLRLLKQIAALHREGRPDLFRLGASKYTHDELTEIFRDENKPVFVAVDTQGHVLGYVFCILTQYSSHAVFCDHASLYIDDLCVDETVRGQSIGKRLFEAVKEYALQAGIYHIDLNVWEFNENAIRFYEKCGFATQRRRMELIL